MNTIGRKLETVANIAIIVVAILFSAVIIQKYLLPSSSQPERAAPVIGKQMNLSDVNWASQPKTLVLALSTNCRFCDESAPFYKRLLEETKGKNIRFVAVFPTKTEDSTKHLEKLGINGFEVKQAPTSALDASGTPTLILTNDKGEVTNFWIGRLPANKESEVINQLNS
jgi:thiol-disulfide isomerase/thioredoxin